MNWSSAKALLRKWYGHSAVLETSEAEGKVRIQFIGSERGWRLLGRFKEHSLSQSISCVYKKASPPSQHVDQNYVIYATASGRVFDL